MASLRQQLEEAQQKALLEQKKRQDEEMNHGEIIKELKLSLNKEKEKYTILNTKVYIQLYIIFTDFIFWQLNDSQNLVQTLQKKMSEDKYVTDSDHTPKLLPPGFESLKFTNLLRNWKMFDCILRMQS